MFGQNKIICIAGKNECAVEFIKFASTKISKKNILILTNKSDNGKDNWQPSLKKFAKENKYKLIKIKDLYDINNLIFISIEYESIINTRKFLSKELFNFHFSLLPKYRGCHTNFFQIYNGEKLSGVTLHKIDNGIDTGPIIDQLKFTINKNSTAFDNYNILMKTSIKLFKKNFIKIISAHYKTRKQILSKGSYYSRKSIDYNKMKYFSLKKINLKHFNQIKAFIFPPLQLPVLNNKKISSIKFINNNFKIIYD